MSRHADLSAAPEPDAAGVSIGGLYEFFPNKEAILDAMARPRLRRDAAEEPARLPPCARDAAATGVMR